MPRLALYILFTYTVLVPLTGCAVRVAEKDDGSIAQASTRCAAPHRLVVAIDRSGSYDVLAAGLQQLAVLLERSACPGDETFIRWVSADSYRTDQAVFSAVYKTLPPQPQSRNPVAARQFLHEQQAWQQRAQVFDRQRKDVATRIRALNEEKATATDILGFLAKASELVASTPPGAQAVIVMVTDLEDNVGRTVSLDLAGAPVIVLAFKGDDPVQAQALREFWKTRLAEAHAGPVVFRDASEPITNTIDELVTSALAP